MTKLSVNINKIATLRNSRGGTIPSVVGAAVDSESFGAQGITVHPRPDERHITKQDVYDLSEVVKTEFNIEGNPDDRFMSLVKDVKPAQATLVPDGPDAITSNAGWDTVSNKTFLTDICGQLREKGIRSSVFVDPDPVMVRGAAECGADRIELYTESYAVGYELNPEIAIAPYLEAAQVARDQELGINAGHDLNLDNLKYFWQNIDGLLEVSIGHALIADALYMGLANTIRLYLQQLKELPTSEAQL